MGRIKNPMFCHDPVDKFRPGRFMNRRVFQRIRSLIFSCIKCIRLVHQFKCKCAQWVSRSYDSKPQRTDFRHRKISCHHQSAYSSDNDTLFTFCHAVSLPCGWKLKLSEPPGEEILTGGEFFNSPQSKGETAWRRHQAAGKAKVFIQTWQQIYLTPSVLYKTLRLLRWALRRPAGPARFAAWN